MGWERPEGSGPEVRKRARPRSRSRPSDCRVAPSPARAVAAAPASRDREAQDVRALRLAPPPRVRTSGATGCASAPLVVFAGVCGPDPGHWRCANHPRWYALPSRERALHRFIVNGHRRCCGPDYVAGSPHGPAAHEDLPYPGNIISFTQSAARKAISPVFTLQGRCGPGSEASQSAMALAFISMSISA